MAEVVDPNSQELASQSGENTEGNSQAKWYQKLAAKVHLGGDLEGSGVMGRDSGAPAELASAREANEATLEAARAQRAADLEPKTDELGIVHNHDISMTAAERTRAAAEPMSAEDEVKAA